MKPLSEIFIGGLLLGVAVSARPYHWDNLFIGAMAALWAAAGFISAKQKMR